MVYTGIKIIWRCLSGLHWVLRLCSYAYGCYFVRMPVYVCTRLQVSAMAAAEHLAKRDRAASRARRTIALRRLAACLAPEANLGHFYSHLVRTSIL
jgi:hypothetical protein